MGIPGMLKGFNDARVAVKREFGSDDRGITTEEAIDAGLSAITSYIADTAFEKFNPDQVPNVRVIGPATSVNSYSIQEFDPKLVDAARQVASPEPMTFEPEVITRRPGNQRGETKANSRDPVTVTISGGTTLDNGPIDSDLPISDTSNIEAVGSARTSGRPALY